MDKNVDIILVGGALQGFATALGTPAAFGVFPFFLMFVGATLLAFDIYQENRGKAKAKKKDKTD